ncbi:MAG: hypothetical protein QM820_50570 [Minicystis sp.]
MNRNTRPGAVRLAFFATIALAAAAFAMPACGGNDNPTPTTSSSSSASSTSSSGAGGTGGSGETTSSSTGTGGSGTGGSGTGGTGGTGGAAPNCDGPNGCYACAPKKNEEFLNACTTAQCSPFDNAARLPLYNNGNLPPVP